MRRTTIKGFTPLEKIGIYYRRLAAVSDTDRAMIPKRRIFLTGFTLVELMVVITIIMILTTFVSLNLTSAKKAARDNKRISDAQVLASALDQYAASNARIYPLGDPSKKNPVDLSKNVSQVQVTDKLKAYINPVPSDPTGAVGYQYIYAYREDGRKASIIVAKFETGRKLCNIKSDHSNLPREVNKYLESYPTACYYVSR